MLLLIERKIHVVPVLTGGGHSGSVEGEGKGIQGTRVARERSVFTGSVSQQHGRTYNSRSASGSDAAAHRQLSGCSQSTVSTVL